jgi:hypothetical protein
MRLKRAIQAGRIKQHNNNLSLDYLLNYARSEYGLDAFKDCPQHSISIIVKANPPALRLTAPTGLAYATPNDIETCCTLIKEQAIEIFRLKEEITRLNKVITALQPDADRYNSNREQKRKNGKQPKNK